MNKIEMSKEEVMTCPFCGALPVGKLHRFGTFEIGCNADDHDAKVFKETREDAVKTWNARSAELASYRIGYADGIRAARAEAKKVVEKIMKQEVEGG